MAAPGVHLPTQEAELRREDAGRRGEGWGGSGGGEVCTLGGEEGGEGGRGGRLVGGADDGWAVVVGGGRSREGEGDFGSR